MRDLAKRLTAARLVPEQPDAQRVLVSEKLRLSLTRIAGAGGFAALLRRSLSLVSATMPALEGVKVDADGRIEGLGRIAAHGDAVWQEASEAVTAQMLDLLVTFIGEPLTRRLAREALAEGSPAEER